MVPVVVNRKMERDPRRKCLHVNLPASGWPWRLRIALSVDRVIHTCLVPASGVERRIVVVVAERHSKGDSRTRPKSRDVCLRGGCILGLGFSSVHPPSGARSAAAKGPRSSSSAMLSSSEPTWYSASSLSWLRISVASSLVVRALVGGSEEVEYLGRV